MSYLHLATTEREFLEATEAVVNILCGKFRAFGYSSRDDIAQQLRLFCWEAMPRYKPDVGPLRNFLFQHAKNRYLNSLRPLQGRVSEPPCKICHRAQAKGEPGPHNGTFCKSYVLWQERNRTRRRLASPCDITVADEQEPRMKAPSTVETDAETAELIAFLDERLNNEERRVWLMLREGARVEKKDRDAIHQRLLEILEEAGLTAEDLGLHEQEKDLADNEPEGQAA